MMVPRDSAQRVSRLKWYYSDKLPSADSGARRRVHAKDQIPAQGTSFVDLPRIFKVPFDEQGEIALNVSSDVEKLPVRTRKVSERRMVIV